MGPSSSESGGGEEHSRSAVGPEAKTVQASFSNCWSTGSDLADLAAHLCWACDQNFEVVVECVIEV